jgi:hypothetical protein
VDIRIPRDGATFWFESPEYWDEWYGYTTQKRQSDVAIYSSIPPPLAVLPKASEAVEFRRRFLDVSDD